MGAVTCLRERGVRCSGLDTDYRCKGCLALSRKNPGWRTLERYCCRAKVLQVYFRPESRLPAAYALVAGLGLAERDDLMRYDLARHVGARIDLRLDAILAAALREWRQGEERGERRDQKSELVWPNDGEMRPVTLRLSTRIQPNRA